MTKIYVEKSKINGKGIFVKKNIKKGEIIFIAKGKIIKFSTDAKNAKESRIGSNWIGINKNIWLNIVKYSFRFINHFCNPNAGIKGKVIFVALRDIKKDEEITFDYSISEDDILWQMKCSCGQKNCRKIIRSIQFLPVKTFKKYLPYIPTYFKKVYLKYHKMQQK